MEKGAFKGKHFLALEDFTPEELRYLLDLSLKLKAEKSSMWTSAGTSARTC